MDYPARYSTTSNRKQKAVEDNYRFNRKKLHPVTRMEDVLNPVRCGTLANVVQNMAERMQQLSEDPSSDKCGVWYDVPIAMNRDGHLKTDGRWDNLLHRVQTQLQLSVDRYQQTGSAGKDLHWHADLIPASRNFVVYHVLKTESGASHKRKLDPLNNYVDLDRFSGQSEKEAIETELPAMDPIYHMYIQCRRDPVIHSTDDNDFVTSLASMEFLDVMYNRWAVQNTSFLRSRILQQKSEQLGIKLQASAIGDVGGENRFANRGTKTSRAIAMSRAMHTGRRAPH